MKFTPETCPFPHRPYQALLSPRPIAWVGTRGKTGDNLAPFSFFNQLSVDPLLLAISFSKPADRAEKDSAANILETGEFSVAVVGYDDRKLMAKTSEPTARGVDEFEHAGVVKAECELIDAPRVANAAASFECKTIETVNLPGGSILVVGEAIMVHIRGDIIEGERVNVERYRPLARLGYADYADISKVYELKDT